MDSYLLFSTSHCHLCELAEQLLVVTMDASCHQVDIVDIAYDDNLLTRYGNTIPVLQHESSGAEICWPFDQPQLIAFLEGCATGESSSDLK
ncbi:glutaredoxin family protein [Neptunomonas sp. XY-337]|uniref:glutaredoxin family protein n=1 Tax=Neptunomonas sp. XY-337 TaxID=2561897 RepID=UPI0010A9F7B3|nr:glutaredoxin family protein [Neptunomonas sp. XY-337]